MESLRSAYAKMVPWQVGYSTEKSDVGALERLGLERSIVGILTGRTILARSELPDEVGVYDEC